MKELKKEYIDNAGNIFNIKNLSFDNKNDMNGNLGDLITETKRKFHGFYTEDDNLISGVYIYQDRIERSKALRIYKDWADYKYTYHDDARFLSELLKRQKNIKLTEFPTGIVTLENYCIGQIIKFYEGYKILGNLKDLKNIRQLIFYYQEILNILKELVKENIIYTDIHSGNFMVKNDSVKLIDFESSSLKLGYDDYIYKKMVNDVKNMFNAINKYYNINMKLEDSDTIEKLQEEIITKTKKL